MEIIGFSSPVGINDFYLESYRPMIDGSKNRFRPLWGLMIFIYERGRKLLQTLGTVFVPCGD